MKNVVTISVSLVIGLTVASSFSNADMGSFLGRPVLIQELDGNGVAKNQYLDSFQKELNSSKFISQSPDISSFGAFGVCFNSDSSPCLRELTSKAEFGRAMATGNGRKEMDASLLPPMQDFPISSTTTIEKEESDAITIKIEQKLLGVMGNQSTKLKISRLAKLSIVPHVFKIPEKDESNRKPINAVDSQFRELSYGVVQLNSRPDNENLLGNSSGSGTGWFISGNGLMMTNHHVINDFKACMQDLACEIDFKQVTPGGRRAFTAKVTILVFSEQYDFALLKVELPKDLKFSFFKIETTQVGKDLMTLGYPGDFREGDDIRLTYSFGNLVGFHSRAYATSTYIYQGASGSPLLNRESMNVVAIISNGAGNPIPGIGAPGLARPILLIDSEFGLSDYISGAKMSRVQNILVSLGSSKSVAQAALILTDYQRERTFMGLNSLKRMMLNHPVADVRLEIMRTLEKMKVLIGSSDIADELLEEKPQVSPKIFLPPKG